MLSGRVSGSVTFLHSFAQSNIQEAFKVKSVPANDPKWHSHLAHHVEHDDPVFEGLCMTADAVDLLRKVDLLLDQPSQVLTS